MRRVITVSLLLGVMLLSGCGVVQFDEPTPSVADCTGEDVGWRDSRSTLTLTGACAELTVTASFVVISGGSFESVVIEGDGVVLSASGPIGRLSIEGGDNTISATSVGSALLVGDRNAIDAATVTGLSVRGDDNGIDAVVSGDVADNGTGNSIGE